MILEDKDWKHYTSKLTIPISYLRMYHVPYLRVLTFRLGKYCTNTFSCRHIQYYSHDCLGIAINGVLGPYSAPVRLTGTGTSWANEINFVMNHAPGAGSIARPVDQ